ncbi:MAG TPA: ABC transporter permease subunit/CPBP intramembrane protease [Lacipirellulaceae bacterium]|nr:ABC transporter permease subunit/CPBP intramembrane protease [Lacipirellulaceae bacterium]
MGDDRTRPERPRQFADRRRQTGRLWRLILKELREILRDRRTIITLVVMPLLIYPLLAVAFQRFLVTSLAVNEDVEYAVGVDSTLDGQLLERQLSIGASALDSDKTGEDSKLKNAAEGKVAKPAPPDVNIVVFQDENVERYVADSTLHLAVIHRRRQHVDRDKPGLQTPQVWDLIYRAGSPTSEAALHFVESRLQKCNELQLNDELKRLGVVAALPAATERKPITFNGAPAFSLAALIPLILVLMTVTGAVYPAIDLTAGERERGTLETLIAAPVPRIGLLLAKYVAVLAVALLTAIVNLAGMTITAHSTGLAASLFGGGMSFGVVLKVLLLLALFAAFFSAILLALTSYARSFKEAQAYIIPLMLLCLVPGVLCLMPSLEFKAWMAVTPLVNIVVLARDLLEGSVQPGLAIAAVCSTIFYIGAAIALAARIFGTDAILYGSPATWSDLVRRPSTPQRSVTLAGAMLGLALMFPAYFVLANDLAGSPELSMAHRLVVCGLITAAVFAGIPIAVATIARVRWSSGLGLQKANIGAFLVAVVLGVSLWPIAHEIFLISESLGLSSLGSKQIAAAEAMLAQFKNVPLSTILITLAIIPAVCEELCFRGFVFGGLRTRLNGGWAIVISAILFGVFHEVLFPGRLLASMFLGLVLGFVRLRSGSVLPGMLLHSTHNGLLLTLSYYRDELIARGWGMQDEKQLPISWHLAALVGVFVGMILLAATTQRKPDSQPSPPD